ncbi:PilW family protein [Neisseria elongata]|uniref:Prepilin-type N-terminal cleavage/methylation domain-containing protein n=1 Tax=Neisseria elongata subsp. nitroreducens TaxID=90367 RepID=A0A9X1CWR5_NEIEL|nr:prepilin-type N-terminal cleavage/methylation domain-containing protein [Neisseria elongata]MBS9339331.1 prepilin-type N-terminal cleavage/methylation domain-containing protein [Neisseria elongata subsp. nitroreducens]MBS9341146.1 prepilin-type N-terminal cleavage/methylation domain-containing protein [Neisseria elongata subsp. nitroreducens]
MKRQNNRYTVLPKKITGFTLIELLVASALSIIVLIAAGSGFVTTQKLSQVAKGRLQVQNDLRNATNMIVRDARMAGSFGCFNLAKMATNDQTKLKDHGAANVLGALEYNNQNQGVKYLDGAALSLPGFTVSTSSSKVLLFTYGIGSSSGYSSSGANSFSVQIEEGGELAELAKQANAPIIISTCSSLERFPSSAKELSGSVLTVKNLSPNLSPDHDTQVNPKLQSEISVFRQVVNIYAIGTPTGGEEGLYLFQLNPNGEISAPQLLLAGVTSWELEFGYVQSPGCKSMQNDTKIKFVNNIESNKAALSPALLRMQLKGSGGGGEVKSGKAANNSESDVQTYYINATIRGGNSCAERNFQEDAN